MGHFFTWDRQGAKDALKAALIPARVPAVPRRATGLHKPRPLAAPGYSPAGGFLAVRDAGLCGALLLMLPALSTLLHSVCQEVLGTHFWTWLSGVVMCGLLQVWQLAADLLI